MGWVNQPNPLFLTRVYHERRKKYIKKFIDNTYHLKNYRYFYHHYILKESNYDIYRNN